MDMEEVKREVKGGKVIEAKRLQTYKAGTKAESLSVMITFEKTLPAEVRMGWINFKVREFIPQPIRCYKCQRMGHTASQCKGKQRCVKCGGDHEWEKCEKDTKPKCCNCGGEHSAAYAGCTVIKQAKEVQRYKIVNKVSYAEAARSVGEIHGKAPASRPIEIQTHMAEIQNDAPSISSAMSRKPRTPRSPPSAAKQQPQQLPQPQPCTHKCKINENTLIVDKKKFVMFMCNIVNVVLEHKGKSDKIRAVVAAAKEFLEMKDIQATEIDAMMRPRDDLDDV